MSGIGPIGRPAEQRVSASTVLQPPCGSVTCTRPQGGPMRRNRRLLRVAAVGMLATGTTVGLGSSNIAEANPASCTSYQLPTLPGGDGGGEVIAITAGGIYGGDASDADGVGHA